MANPSGQPGTLSAVGAIARAHDPDRFLAALFAPPDRREAIFTLIAFNHELARALDVAAASAGDYGGMGGHIRLQWWRDVLDDRVGRRHEVATPLAALIEPGPLPNALLGAIIDARAAELDGLDDSATWQDALRGGPGNLARATAILLGAPADALDPVADAGAAYAVGKILRHLPTLRALGRHPLPRASEHDEDHAAAIAWGRQLLDPARTVRLPRPQRAALLTAVLARRDLARAARGRPQDHARGAGDRLAVLLAHLTGRP